MEKELLLFQIGPVQEFIAQAETLGDLRVGSELLSDVTAAALRTIPDYETEAVFPAVERMSWMAFRTAFSSLSLLDAARNWRGRRQRRRGRLS